MPRRLPRVRTPNAQDKARRTGGPELKNALKHARPSVAFIHSLVLARADFNSQALDVPDYEESLRKPSDEMLNKTSRPISAFVSGTSC